MKLIDYAILFVLGVIALLILTVMLSIISLAKSPPTTYHLTPPNRAGIANLPAHQAYWR